MRGGVADPYAVPVPGWSCFLKAKHLLLKGRLEASSVPFAS